MAVRRGVRLDSRHGQGRPCRILAARQAGRKPWKWQLTQQDKSRRLPGAGAGTRADLRRRPVASRSPSPTPSSCKKTHPPPFQNAYPKSPTSGRVARLAFFSLKHARCLFASYQRLGCGLAACKSLASTKLVLCAAPSGCHAKHQSDALPAFRSRLHTAPAGPTIFSATMRPQEVTCAESTQCR